MVTVIVVGVVTGASAFAIWRDRASLSSTPRLPKGVVARLEVTVEERDGTVRRAHLECATQNKASGYLAAPTARASACETALINPDALDYLHGERVAGCRRDGAIEDDDPAVVRFRGVIRPREVDRVLRVDDEPCGADLVKLLQPLLEPSSAPNLEPLSP